VSTILSRELKMNTYGEEKLKLEDCSNDLLWPTIYLDNKALGKGRTHVGNVKHTSQFAFGFILRARSSTTEEEEALSIQ
jgi:hypothetical protein